jgi:hypothetical protein
LCIKTVYLFDDFKASIVSNWDKPYNFGTFFERATK